jgi:hypothetical protein
MTEEPNPGDVPINVWERRFSLPDAAFLARVPEVSIRNWQSRKIIAMGEKHLPSGRWYFSLEDTLRFAVMHDLCVRPGLDFGPKRAAVIAEVVVNAAIENTSQPRQGFRQNLNIVIAWGEDGDMFTTAADIRNPGNFYPPVSPRDGDEYSPFRRSIITIPAAAMLIDLFLRTEHLQKRNRRAEAPTHA